MNYRNVKALIKSEISNYLVSPVTYVFIVIFLVLTGFFTFFFGGFFEIQQAFLMPFFQWHPWVLLLLIPAVGMSIWSDERRLGTIELLFTLPVTVAECIVSKFLAAWLVTGVALALTFPMIFTVYSMGEPDAGPIISGYLGSFLMAGSYLAIAGFTSALTKSQVVSFILSASICTALVLVGHERTLSLITGWAPHGVVDAIASCSILNHYFSLQRGVIDSSDIVYFLSLIVLSLFLTGCVLRSHRGS